MAPGAPTNENTLAVILPEDLSVRVGTVAGHAAREARLVMKA
jgi:hypothetical protein